ncbi:MAG TPA: copper resistance protein CopC [Candidatus Bathyarchaeia archaeon]|nr:copper resistance protein CopC [Candidatus Bathyarchaeia archaeon]
MKINVGVLSTVLAIMISGLSGVCIPHYAYAHSLPVTESPAANSIIPKGAALPSKLTIDFSERPSPTVSSLTVINSKNEQVSNGDFKVIGDGGREAMTTLDTKKLTDGIYTVEWETKSLDDGHIAKGSFVFGIGNAGPGAAASEPSIKNNTYAIQTKIMNVNAKIEINPFYSGFNTFKVTFTDAAGKPYTKVTSAEIVFNNAAADITNEVANLQKIRPGIFSVTGGYISQPGEWDMTLSAQRVQDVDLYYQFTGKVTNPMPQSADDISNSMNMDREQMSGMKTNVTAPANTTAAAPPSSNTTAAAPPSSNTTSPSSNSSSAAAPSSNSSSASTKATTEPTSGQSFVWQGTTSSQPDPLSGHGKEYVAIILSPRSDNNVYSGLLTYSASRGANVEIWHNFSPGNTTAIPKSFGAMKIASPQYGTTIALTDISPSASSGSVPFSGNAVLLHASKPFTVTYTVNAVAQPSKTVNNIQSLAQSTTSSSSGGPSSMHVTHVTVHHKGPTS